MTQLKEKTAGKVIVAAKLRPRRSIVLKDIALRYGMVFVLVGLVVAAQIAYPRFLSPENIQNTMTQNASMAIVAVGMTFVIIGGGFDLSVAGIVGLASVTYAGLVITGSPVGIAALVALAVGALCGLANGLIVTKLRVNAFVATLATASVFLGIAALLSSSRPLFVPAVPGFDALGTGRAGPLSITFLVIVVLFVLGGVVLSRSVYGRTLYATGGNSEAARLAGLNVSRISTVSFMVSATLASVAGIVMASKLSVGQFDQGGTVAMDSIAAVVLGGTSIYGGSGAMWRTVVGVGILATMNNLFSSLSIASPTQNIIKGLVLVAAVAFGVVVHRRSTR